MTTSTRASLDTFLLHALLFSSLVLLLPACSMGTEDLGSSGEAAIGAACDGPLDYSCGAGEVCVFTDATNACGAANQPGVCIARPRLCPENAPLVCGCDGITYANDCFANQAGVSVAHAGPCDTEPSPQACGGPLDNVCPSGEFCDYDDDALCGNTNIPGHCVALPLGCPDNVDPVCGCDGVTYFNACEAHVHGVSIASAGACETDEPQACGGPLDNVCPEDEFCSYGADASCGNGNIPGHCLPRPLGCPDNYDPVCGCDGRTYGNACEANAAGASVAHIGACRSDTNRDNAG